MAPESSAFWISSFTTSTDGEYIYLNAVSSLIGIEEKEIDDSESIPGNFVFALNSIVPNPFVGVARIDYSVAEPCVVDLKIYEATGRLVKTLVSKEMSVPNNYRVYWHGNDDRNRTLSAGVYFVRFEAGDFQTTKKTLLLR